MRSANEESRRAGSRTGRRGREAVNLDERLNAYA
jgi:hypothetical protein